MKNLKTKKVIAKEEKGITFMYMGLLAFLGLGLEFLVIFLDNIVFGEAVKGGFKDYTVTAHVFHWSVTMVIWGMFAYCLFAWSKKRGLFNKMFSFDLNKGNKKYIILAVIGAVLLTVFEVYALNEGFPQIFEQYNKFKSSYGNKAVILSIFQNAYYFVEVILVVLLIAFMQMAGEKWFKNKSIPYGGIALMLTWGLGHFTHGLVDTIFISVFSILPGMLYVLSKKNFIIAYLFIILIFLL
jgi:hypothetical protein